MKRLLLSVAALSATTLTGYAATAETTVAEAQTALYGPSLEAVEALKVPQAAPMPAKVMCSMGNAKSPRYDNAGSTLAASDDPDC
jgi:hypothetical protein